jgi:putative hydrolase
VVPNVEAFAGEHGLDHRQVRLWAAAHEVIHHAILAIPWVRGHLVAVMDDYYAAVNFDPGKLTDALAMVEQPDEIEEMIGGAGGLSALLGAESDPELLAPIQALLATIEGYGDHVVRRALEEIVPDLTRLEESAGRRRAEPSQAAQFLQQLVGLDLERHRARDAAALFAEIDRRWGEDAVGRVWTGQETLPTRDELTDPVGWAARVLLDD